MAGWDMHKILSVIVVGFWAVMLAALGSRTMSGNPPDAPASMARDGRESWMGIYLEGGKVGYAHELIEKTPDGYRITEEMSATLTVMQTSQVMRMETVSNLDEGMSLRDFDFSVRSGLADMKIKGKVVGSAIQADINTAGRVNSVTIPVNGPIHLASDLELIMDKEGLAPGKKFRMPFFDPSTLSEQYMDVEVEELDELKLGERVVPVYRVRQNYADVTVTSWVSPELGTIKSEGMMGFTFLMETREQAMSRPKGGYAATDIIALVSIPAEGGGVPDPRGATRMRAELTGAKLDGLDMNDGRQALEGGTVTVNREDISGIPSYFLPYEGRPMNEYLSPSSFVQSDDPKIKARAAEILSGEKDAQKAARKLADWVYKEMAKRPSAGIPSAVEVLGNMEGDCNEHTVLYTALARSAGIPSRMAAGIVLMGDRFYYHAWPEVYIGGWVSIDPTFGQFPADATHVKLVEGGPDRQVAILKLIGNLKVRILEHG